MHGNQYRDRRKYAKCRRDKKIMNDIQGNKAVIKERSTFRRKYIHKKRIERSYSWRTTRRESKAEIKHDLPGDKQHLHVCRPVGIRSSRPTFKNKNVDLWQVKHGPEWNVEFSFPYLQGVSKNCSTFD